MTQQPAGPLVGLRVLDFSIVVGGATAATLLGDFGAEVVKVERPGVGDPLRTWGPFKNGESLWWKTHSRNKKSITLNLASPTGQDVARQLAAKADVVIESYQPGLMDKWGLHYEALSQKNPGLVMVRVSGFGQSGPYKDLPGFGTIAEAMSGLVNVTGFPESPPVLPPIPLADEIAGTFGAMAAMMALWRREKSGQGQWIDVSLYEPLFRLLVPNIPEYDQCGVSRGRIGNEYQDSAPRSLYRCKDGGWVALSGSTQGIFEKLAQCIGQPELIADPRFKDNASRCTNRKELNAALQKWMDTRTVDEAVKIIRESGATAGKVYDTPAILKDPHYQARDDIVSVADEALGFIKMAGIVPKFSATPGAVHSTGPKLGEHNVPVYRDWLGYDSDKLAKMKNEGVI